METLSEEIIHVKAKIKEYDCMVKIMPDCVARLILLDQIAKYREWLLSQ